LGGTQHFPLGAGDAVEGIQLLGVDGLVVVDKVGAEAFELVDVFDADDEEAAGGGETVLQGVLGGTGLS
jgi:hypothetical protein